MQIFRVIAHESNQGHVFVGGQPVEVVDGCALVPDYLLEEALKEHNRSVLRHIGSAPNPPSAEELEAAEEAAAAAKAKADADEAAAAAKAKADADEAAKAKAEAAAAAASKSDAGTAKK